MERLGTFQLNNTFRLFQLAKQLHQRQFFESFLNDFQFQIINYVLAQDSFELWRHFLEGNCSLRVIKEALDSEPEDVIEEGSRPVTLLALHVRYLLWERAIDYFFGTPNQDTSDPAPTFEEISDEYELIEQLDLLPENEKTPDVEQEEKAVREEEEDDYDDDEPDEKPEEESAQDIPAVALNFNDDGQVVLEIAQSAFATKAVEPEPEPELEGESPSLDVAGSPSQDDQEALIKSFNKVYHNFEYDRETLMKRRKLEKSDMQLENKALDEDISGSIPINLGVASTSLKHLLNTIQDNREEIPLNDFELRSLFLDVRKNRGKWANDERVGQEELYEACEKVLLDLRGYTEHSTPFLNKVSKREAPNYGLIIRKPMDLNTVMKKMKNLSYNSKEEFVEDLMLIWNNCLTYNADPKHYLRAHAIAMQKRTQRLTPTIPNIVIRNRTDIENDEEVDNDKSSTPALKGGKTSKKGRKRRREELIKAEDLEDVADSAKLSEAPSVIDTPIISALETPQLENAVVNGEENPDEEEEEGEDAENDMGDQDDENEDEQDPELQAWRTLTAKSRANYCAARADLFDEDYKLRMDSEAIIRESSKMKNFNQFLDNREVVSKSNKLLDNDEPYLLEYDVAGGIPGIAYRGIDDAFQDKHESDMVEAILRNTDGIGSTQKSGFVLPLDTGLSGLYHGNITEIQEIRKICFKISLIRQMQTQQFMHRTQMRQPEVEYLKEVDLDPVSQLPNHDMFKDEVHYAVLRRNVAKVAMHTGFEATEPFAINILTQVAERYLLNLAKSMKLHCESNTSNELTDREIILLTLLENGIEKPDDLYTFIQEKAMKVLVKLKDLRNKLSGFLKDLLRPSLENFNEKNFEDNSEQFTTGDFTSDLGDDFFGFKELGLDKEFKMLSSSIPIYLLHSRLHNNYISAGTTSKVTKYEDLKDWQTPKLTQADVAEQIGLLQPFYQSLVQKSEAFYIKLQKRKGESTELPPPSEFELIEDEELPQKQRNIRPRLPPTGKIASVKKKMLSAAFILPDEEEEFDPLGPELFELYPEQIKLEA